MLNDTGATAGADAFNMIDTWIGGLAEAHVPGGLLGSTFDLVFVNQMENLINGDRFYYLVRLFGQQFGEEVNNGQFKDIVERNTGLEHLNGSIFAYADKYYDLAADAALPTNAALYNKLGVAYYTDADDNLFSDAARTIPATLAAGYTALYVNASATSFVGRGDHKYGQLFADNPTLGIWSDGSANPNSINGNGAIITVGGVQYIRDFRPDLAPDALHPVEGTPTSGAEFARGHDRH